MKLLGRLKSLNPRVKKNSYMELVVELPSGQRVFMSEREYKQSNDRKKNIPSA